MKYKIIEDCSPYYVVFTHDNIEEYIATAFAYISNIEDIAKSEFTHYNLSKHNKRQAINLFENTPVSKDLELQDDRVSFFISAPGMYYRAHKDGAGDRYSINYPIMVKDNKCITSWYRDEDLANYSIDRLQNNFSRECVNFDKARHTPIKYMTASTGTCILFNTDIFHDWDNTASENFRVVLTFRDMHPRNVSFEDARLELFGY